MGAQVLEEPSMDGRTSDTSNSGTGTPGVSAFFGEEEFKALVRKKSVELFQLRIIAAQVNSETTELREPARKYYDILERQYREREKVFRWDIDPSGRFAVVLGPDGIAWSYDDAITMPLPLRRSIHDAVYLEKILSERLKRPGYGSLLDKLYYIVELIFQTWTSLNASSVTADTAAEYLAVAEHIDQQLEDVRKISDDLIGRSEIRHAQQTYVIGMMPGLALVLLAGALSWRLGLWRPETAGIPISIVAGAAGALLSVMARMTRARAADTLNVDAQIGQPLLALGGAFRPIVGSILGLAVFSLIQARLLPLAIPEAVAGLYFVGSVAFLAGFSERLAQDALLRTSHGVFSARKNSDNEVA